MAAVSLFTGIAGLELGLAKPGSQEANKLSVLIHKLTYVSVELLNSSGASQTHCFALFGFSELKLEGSSIQSFSLV